MTARDQQLVDAFTTAIPRLQLILQSAQRQHDDAAAVLDALAHASTLLRPPTHPNGGRTVQNLEIAIVRSGRTVQEIAFLTAISEARIKSIAAGDAATAEEAKLLTTALPDWKA